MPDPGHISIADALFSRTQQRVLGLLFVNPDLSFYTKQIIRTTGMGTGAVTRELSRLVMAGLITMTPMGNQNHYQANPGSPLFEELCCIALKTFGVVDVLREALERELPRINYACIYGSIAKGTAHAESDVDLLVVSDELGFMELQQLLGTAEPVLQRPVNLSLYTFDEFNDKSQTSFLKRMLEQPKLVIKDW